MENACITPVPQPPTAILGGGAVFLGITEAGFVTEIDHCVWSNNHGIVLRGRSTFVCRLVLCCFFTANAFGASLLVSLSTPAFRLSMTNSINSNHYDPGTPMAVTF